MIVSSHRRLKASTLANPRRGFGVTSWRAKVSGEQRAQSGELREQSHGMNE
jgi:hypothetical protein